LTTGDPRAPSVVFKSLQTQGLQVECARLLRTAQPHTDSPSTRPCPSSEELRASVQLVPRMSTTDRPLDRPASKTRDVSNRRLPLERLTAPAPRAFPARSPDLRRVDTPRSLKSPRSRTGGTDVSRRPNRFGGSHRTRFPLCGASHAEAVTDLARGHGRFLPMVPDATEPLTSLSPPTLALGLTRLRACSLFRVSACDLLGAPAGPSGE
jgi:hypothetical protein